MQAKAKAAHAQRRFSEYDDREKQSREADDTRCTELISWLPHTAHQGILISMGFQSFTDLKCMCRGLVGEK